MHHAMTHQRQGRRTIRDRHGRVSREGWGWNRWPSASLLLPGSPRPTSHVHPQIGQRPIQPAGQGLNQLRRQIPRLLGFRISPRVSLTTLPSGPRG